MNARRCGTPLFAWREALTDPKLGPQGVPGLVRRQTMLSVAVVGLSLRMDMAGGCCFPSVRRIADETGLGRRTVQRALRALAEDGWLTIRYGVGRGRTSRYFLRLPRRAEAAIAGGPEQLELPSVKGVNVTPFDPEKASVVHEKASVVHEKASGVTPEVSRRSSGEISIRAREADPAGSVWPSVWSWARTRGEQRTFPQLADVALPDEEVMPVADYERLEAEWRAEGSPDFDPLILFKQNPNPSTKKEAVPT